MKSFEPQPDPDEERLCNDVTHYEGCSCGARPDFEYEKRLDI